MPPSTRLILLGLAGAFALAAAVSPWFGRVAPTSRSQRLGHGFLLLGAIVLAAGVWVSDMHEGTWARLARGAWMASLLLYAVSLSIRATSRLWGERRV